jgi:hypothetical protein
MKYLRNAWPIFLGMFLAMNISSLISCGGLTNPFEMIRNIFNDKVPMGLLIICVIYSSYNEETESEKEEREKENEEYERSTLKDKFRLAASSCAVFSIIFVVILPLVLSFTS